MDYTSKLQEHIEKCLELFLFKELKNFNLTKKYFKLLTKGLTSRYPVDRKLTALLILLTSFKISESELELQKKRLVTKFGGYYCIGLASRTKIQETENYLKYLKRDSRFMKEEIKSTRFFLKYTEMEREDDENIKKSHEVNILTLTEITHFFKEREFKKLPDPLECCIWFYKKFEIDETMNLQYQDEASKVKEKNENLRSRSSNISKKKGFFLRKNQRKNSRKKRRSIFRKTVTYSPQPEPRKISNDWKVLKTRSLNKKLSSQSRIEEKRNKFVISSSKLRRNKRRVGVTPLVGLKSRLNSHSQVSSGKFRDEEKKKKFNKSFLVDKILELRNKKNQGEIESRSFIFKKAKRRRRKE